MALYQATDDPNLGAPVAAAGPQEAFVLLAPDSCVVDATVAPPTYTFSRFDYSWLSLALASAGSADRVPAFFDQFFVGTHTLAWGAMHDTVERAINSGFQISEPTDIFHAIKLALAWSELNSAHLRPLQAGDFELLPAVPRAGASAWWRTTPFTLWIADGLLHVLCHFYGYCGAFWDAPSRTADSRFYLCLSLTQDFITVSANIPAALYGEPAARFYSSTMLPHRFLRFPSSIPGLLNALTVRWGYFFGTSVHSNTTLFALLPLMVKECPNAQRFLHPSRNGSSQVSAYLSIWGMFNPGIAAHRFEALTYVDKKLATYLPLVDQADASPDVIYCDARVVMLKDAIENEHAAIASAPKSDSAGTKGEAEGPACQKVITALIQLRGARFISDLEVSLSPLWSPDLQLPTQVFETTLASRSLTCIAILFSNLSGVRDAGEIYSILEQASHHRLQYFTSKLSTPEDEEARPDHTRWFAYPLKIDTCLRSPDLETFKKINFMELGAQVRRLREKTRYESADLPKFGQEFNFEHFQEHLVFLHFLQPWLEALGFDMRGKQSFLEATRVLSLFCQHGIHYKGKTKDIHREHMRQLYQAFLEDMHKSMKPFWKTPILVYKELMPTDAMFPVGGAFYSAHRDLKLEVVEQDRLARLGYVPQPQAAQASASFTNRSQFAQFTAAPGSSGTGQLTSNRTPAFSELGSFAYAIKDEADVLSILGMRYAKRPILDKLNLKEEEICLPSYLSRKGAAACPYSNRSGHDRLDSALHTFSESALAMRPMFEQSPFRLPREESFAFQTAPRGRAGGQRSAGRLGNRGGSASSK